MADPQSKLKVFTFAGGFGLPTLGPFALKLLTWLRLAGIEYEQCIEDDTRKGPKGKNPWIELDGIRLGDTELIIEELSRRYSIDLDGRFDSRDRAFGVALVRMVEEHLHQVFEWELLVEDEGFRHLAPAFKRIPLPLRPLIMRAFRGHFRKQLTARGIGRHDERERTRMGEKDIAALATLLAGRSYALGNEPGSVDATLFGFLAIMVFSPLETPVFRFAREQPSLVDYCWRVQKRLFSEAVVSVGGVQAVAPEEPPAAPQAQELRLTGS